jgi:hypothetical protein
MKRRRVVNEFNRLFFTGRINDAIQRLSGCPNQHNQKLQSFSFSGMNTVNIMGEFLVDPLQRREH